MEFNSVGIWNSVLTFKSLPTPTKHEDNGGRKASHRLRRQNPSQTRQSKQTHKHKHTLFFFFFFGLNV